MTVKPYVAVYGLAADRPGVYGTGLYGTDVYNAPTWAELKPMGKGGDQIITFEAGTDNELDQPTAATMRMQLLLDNSDPVIPLLQYGSRVVYSVIVDNASFPRFTGSIVDEEHWAVGPGFTAYDIRCADEYERIARDSNVTFGWFAGDSVHNAIATTLNAVAWISPRSIDQPPYEPVEGPDVQTEVMDRLMKLAVTAMGHVFIDFNGTYRFKSRQSRFIAARGGPKVDLDTIKHDPVRYSSDDRGYLTRATVHNSDSGITTVNAARETASGKFGTDIDTYLRYGDRMADYGDWLLVRYGNRLPKASAVNMPLGDDSVDAAAVLSLGFMDRANLGGLKYNVTRISDTWRPGGALRVALTLARCGADENVALYNTDNYGGAQTYGW